jgi:hypothetical protein
LFRRESERREEAAARIVRAAARRPTIEKQAGRGKSLPAGVLLQLTLEARLVA